MFPWMKLRKKTDPEIPYEPPIHLGNKSNGEFFYEQTPLDRKIRAEILRRADDNARKLGMERREFMASTMGMVTSLAVVNAASGCGDDNGNTEDGKDGGYIAPKDAELDCTMSNTLLSGDEFIMDLQTHEIEDKEHWLEDHPGGMYGGPGFASFIVFYDCEFGKDPKCIGEDAYVENIFLNADTTVAVLSGFPSNICDDAELCNALVSNQFMVDQRNKINDASGGSQRMVQHVQVAPNDNWPKQAEMMRRIREQHGNHGWKCYPPWGPGGGWRMDDPEIAYPFYDLARELKNPLICAHKGFPLQGFNRLNADPADVGPAAVANPDLTFVIYHSAYEIGMGNNAYDPNATMQLGVDRLVKTIKDHDLKGKNVYAELGSAWALSYQTAKGSQHLLGKLLEALGEDNVVFGSECLWMGSPQPQIEALRTITISQEFQDMYGYPAITDSVRRKIMGLNGARIYGIDPEAVRCDLDKSKLAMLKRDMDGELGGRRWAFAPQGGPSTRREFMNLQRFRWATKRPA